MLNCQYNIKHCCTKNECINIVNSNVQNMHIYYLMKKKNMTHKNYFLKINNK